MVLLAFCKPCIRFRWSLYRFRPKSTHLSRGTLGLPSWGLDQYFLSEARICIAYHIPHIMPCFASCCLRIAPWLIVGSFACVLALGRARRRVRDRGTHWVRLRGLSYRQLGEHCRQDDHTLQITSIFALLVVRSIAMSHYLPLDISCLPYCHVKHLTHLPRKLFFGYVRAFAQPLL